MYTLNEKTSIYVAGHRGMVGSAIVRALQARGLGRIVLRSHGELDLLDQAATRAFFQANAIDVVIVAAARVGGIVANAARPADFLYENLVIATNVIGAAAAARVPRLLFLGSSCIYPRECPQPIQEDALLTGPLERTNEGYAVAKIAGVKLCQMYRRQYGCRYISAMPTNLYGPGDNFHPTDSHVIAGLMGRFHAASASGTPAVTVWGSGRARREFLHVDDLAEACLTLVERYDDEGPINVGSGDDLEVSKLAELIKATTGYRGEIVYDATRPDGTPRKLLDSSRIRALGWRPGIALPDGLASVYQWANSNGVLPRKVVA